MQMKTKEIDTTPRKVPFATDKARTATDMLLATAYNISVSLVNLVNLTERIEKRVSDEERTEGMKAFSITVTMPKESEWVKTETTKTPPETKQPEHETKAETGDGSIAGAEPSGIPAENPPTTE